MADLPAKTPESSRIDTVSAYQDALVASHTWFASTPVAWTAADVTRLALCVHLVATGVRPALRIPHPGLGPWQHYARDLASCGRVAVKAAAKRDGQNTPVLYICAESCSTDFTDLDPDADGEATGNVFAGAEARGRLTWMCAAPGMELDLWAEPISASDPAGLGRICTALKAIRAALALVGYAAQARIE